MKTEKTHNPSLKITLWQQRQVEISWNTDAKKKRCAALHSIFYILSKPLAVLWLKVMVLFNINVSSLLPPPSLPACQLKSPGSCSSHVASSAGPQSAHPPILQPWHFQENPSRLEACRITQGREGGRLRAPCWPDWFHQLEVFGLQMPQDRLNTHNPPRGKCVPESLQHHQSFTDNTLTPRWCFQFSPWNLRLPGHKMVPKTTCHPLLQR